MFDVEKSLGFLLAKAYQRAWALFKEALDPYEITPPQFGLLAFLWQQDGLTQVELSEKSQVDRTTVGGLIDRLERTGMVERQPHPQDRRAHMIRLTPKGKTMEDQLTDAAQRVMEQFTAGLADTEINDLVRMLETLRGERKVYEKPVY
ncbi:MarR family winged helix-turn-helix transcriptional regulator [Geobacter sp. SVR]|uniref:MarR family winged helix-turn-helix transcriptional regulator n=1 Tax=Geobacter sp. SVR TaxID=2495594 RepID=UPI00143EFB66|nr:MarR family transcriptional regulator [Geobacter sp. SVR]BCS53410.1 MarR family transcriptional regulator [Geobacter sp. SVR]GCF85464.1 MarR family transcriptional regulator [Geobacter sp. SVR]